MVVLVTESCSPGAPRGATDAGAPATQTQPAPTTPGGSVPVLDAEVGSPLPEGELPPGLGGAKQLAALRKKAKESCAPAGRARLEVRIEVAPTGRVRSAQKKGVRGDAAAIDCLLRAVLEGAQFPLGEEHLSATVTLDTAAGDH